MEQIFKEKARIMAVKQAVFGTAVGKGMAATADRGHCISSDKLPLTFIMLILMHPESLTSLPFLCFVFYNFNFYQILAFAIT